MKPLLRQVIHQAVAGLPRNLQIKAFPPGACRSVSQNNYRFILKVVEVFFPDKEADRAMLDPMFSVRKMSRWWLLYGRQRISLFNWSM